MGKRLRPPMERTDGRRKGYKAFKSTVADRLEQSDPETFRKMQELRGPVRKPRTKPHRTRPHTAPARA